MPAASKRWIALVSLAFISYITASLLRSLLWADIAAPVFDLLASAMVFHAIFSSKNKMFRAHFIITGVAILCWTVADSLWLLYIHVFHADPENNLLVSMFYVGTNVCLISAAIYYAYTNMRKWDTVQLILDGFFFSAAILWLFWALLYNKDFARLQTMLGYNVINLLTITMDLFLIIIIGIWYLSIRRGSIPAFLRIAVGSATLFAFVDIYYFHASATALYTPDSYVDFFYILAILGFALSIVLYYIKYPHTYTNQNLSTNIGHGHRGAFMAICPILIALFRGVDTVDVILYVALIVFHEYSSAYIQKSINNRALLSQERDMNTALQQLVSEQTESLQSANAKLRRRNTRLQYINYHDSLTGLFNRVYFFEQIETYVREAETNENVVLLIWNLDRMKTINDTYGYAVGDQVLALHAKRVEAQFGSDGTLARMGGDEFAYAVKGHYGQEALYPLAARITEACKEPLQISEYTFTITTSIGISFYPNASDSTTLLKSADIAMHHAKASPNLFHVVRYIDISKSIKQKYRIAALLKSAQFEQEISLHFQPQFRIADRRLIGMEALLRWNCPELGNVSPAEFIPIAEEENLIIHIGNWVMAHAIAQIAQWNTRHQTDLCMGINLSPKQLDQPGTLEVLCKAIKKHQAEFNWIDIEITESVALDIEDSTEKINKLFTEKGISVSIDDFGTGYSSLGYLSIQSFDRLKIAKPLIDKITFDDSSRTIVASIVLLAKSLGLATIAEGVETEAQFELLKELGCDQIQGYYLGKPVAADVFEAAFLKPFTANGEPSNVREETP